MVKSVFSEAHGVFIEVLIEARKASGLTQVDVAERLRKPQSFVSNIERGERRVDVLEFVAMAGAVGADPAKLFAEVMRRLPGQISI
jgi:transcriptional regulator with XRE-family HTH domain